MAEGVGRDAGGIHGLLAFHEEHSEAVERDLIALGLRWRDVGSRNFTWRDLQVIVTAAGPDSAVYAVASPDKRAWSTTHYILADIYDAIRWLTYAVIRMGGGKSRKPKPYPRPGREDTQREVTTFKPTKPLPIAELRKWLGWD